MHAALSGKPKHFVLAGDRIDTFSGTAPAYPVQSTWNAGARRIQASTTFVVNRVMSGLGQIVNQAAPPS